MKKQKKLTKHDWNFGDVPEHELEACCYWEFARESTSIHGAVGTIKTALANQGIARPESTEREVFRAAADKAFGLLHSTGFNILFWTELPFPQTWQSADKTKREKWARVLPRIPTPVKFPPFAVTNDLCIAGALYGEARKAHEARQAIYIRLSQIDSGVANLKEACELRKKLSEQEQHAAPMILRVQGGWIRSLRRSIGTSFPKRRLKSLLATGSTAIQIPLPNRVSEVTNPLTGEQAWRGWDYCGCEAGIHSTRQKRF